jgi:acetyl esterase
LALNPKLVEMLESVRASGSPAYHQCTPQQARELIAASAMALGEGPVVHEVVQIEVPVRWGNISANLYRSGPTDNGLIVYLHGGGWCLGTMSDFDALARLLCQQSQCAVLLLDYRLAPEHPYPCGLEDALDGIKWAYQERNSLAGAEVPLMVAGDSSGGNLAAIAVNELNQLIPIAKQLLVYPVTDCNFETESYNQFSSGYFLFKQDMKWFFQHYAPATDWADERISPLRSKKLQGLPSTWVAVADHDVLHDDGVKYARALKANGVDVDLHVYPGMTHGFIRMANVIDVAHQAVCDMGQAARETCQRNLGDNA